MKEDKKQRDAHYAEQIEIQKNDKAELFRMLEEEKKHEQDTLKEIAILKANCSELKIKEDQLSHNNSELNDKLEKYKIEETELKIKLEIV